MDKKKKRVKIIEVEDFIKEDSQEPLPTCFKHWCKDCDRILCGEETYARCALLSEESILKDSINDKSQ